MGGEARKEICVKTENQMKELTEQAIKQDTQNVQNTE